MVLLLISVGLAHSQVGGVTWTKQTTNSTYPRATGWDQVRFDSVSGKTYYHAGYPTQTCTVGVTNGSPTVTLTGTCSPNAQQFSPSWAQATGGNDNVTINSVSKTISVGTVTTTALTLTTNWTGSTSGSATMVTGTGTIYASDNWFYDDLANIWTWLGGQRSIVSTSNVDGDTTLGAGFPSPRHEYQGTCMDSLRNTMEFIGVGANSDSVPVGTHMHSMTRNANPTSNQFVYQVTTNAPGGASPGGLSCVYVPGIDIVFAWGGSQSSPGYCFARTNLNPIPGTLTTAQTNAGCSNPDDWTHITGYTSGVNSPSANNYHFMDYDPGTVKVILYGGQAGSTPKAETWAWDPANHTWTQKGLGGGTPPAANSGSCTPGTCVSWPPMAYVSGLGVFLYHYQGTPTAEWMYTASTDVWTTVSGTGTGPSPADNNTYWYSMTYNSTTRNLIAYQEGGQTMWLGSVRPAARALMSGVSGSGILR